ncbi:MAG: GNAT family N-acetyltransferase [Hyphomicrobiales bacterium]
MSRPAGVEYEVQGGDYSVAIARGHDEAGAVLRSAALLGTASAFQHRIWLTTWFATAGRHPSVRPLVASIRDGARDQLAMLLPLVELREKGRIIIEFADLGVTDYNAPLLGPAAPHTASGAKRLWSALMRELPAADAIRLTKMPGKIGTRPNPLTLLASSRESQLHGNVVSVASYDSFERERGRPYRKELERCWRVFERLGGTEFRQVGDVEGALGFLRGIEEQQRRRIGALGLPYILDAPHIASFYRKLVTDGLGCGYVAMTVLLAGEEVVAALLGLRHGDVFSVLRISNAGEAWKSCSPGRLVIARTMEHLCEEGCTSFDFTTGDYEFKRRLGVELGPLFELTEAKSLWGVPMAAKAAVKERLFRYPDLASRLRRLLQRDATGPRLTMARS